MDVIERGSPVPFYLQLAGIIRGDIAAGRLKPGHRLSTEFELMERFKVSRTTVRQTIARLQEEGLIAVHRGKGTFVAGPRRPPRPATPESHASLLARMASPTPAFGGGAAAALAGAAGAALLAMVCGITARHAPAPDIVALGAAADRLRQRLTALIDEDVAAYEAVLRARRERAAEPHAVQQALARATEAPLAVARASADVLDGCAALGKRARRSTRSDLGVAAALAWAGLESSALTCRVNLGDGADAAFARTVAEELDTLTARGTRARALAWAAATERG